MISDFLNIFLLMAAGQALLLALHLLNKEQKQLPNKILGILMALYYVDLMNITIHTSGYWKIYPHLIGISATIPYLYGPLLFLFAKSISEKIVKLNKIDYLHFLPFAVMNVWGLPNVYFRDAEFKMGLVTGTTNEPIVGLIGALIPFVGIIYVFFASKTFFNYRKKIKENFSNIDQINMEWLRYFIIGNGVVWLFVILAYIVHDFFPGWFKHGWLIYIPVSIFVYVIGYISLSKQSSYLVSSAEIVDGSSGPSYSKSGLTKGQAELIVGNLQKVMKHEKPYKNNTLKLQDLSSAIDIPAHHLTEILNTKLKQSFYDYVNNFRVIEVKNLIKEDKNKKQNLLSLALEAGFSSKSSFNSIFKKQTGLTPSQYRSKTSQQNVA